MPNKGEFHATLERIEPTVYRASYRAILNPDEAAADIELNGPQILPDTHIGDDPQSVKTWVEQMALSLGYDRVIWDEAE